jgi:coenzyme F420 hydrogenase subunit beta
MTKTGSPTVARVVGAQLCTGCGLCASASGAFVMEPVAPGYNRPRQVAPVSPEAERVIAVACPGAVVAPWPAPAHVHPYWGPWIRVATAHATDPAVRHQGSSGGALTGLAIHALRSGRVDRVVHVAADPARPSRNIVTVSDREDEILAGAGSRYAASSPLAEIDRLLSDGGRLAFIGKPCDVSALRQLARVDERVDRHVALMLAFFCAGVPSERGVDRIMAAMGVEPNEVTSFRYRGHGWPGNAVAVTRDGQVREMSYAESWGGYLSKEVQFRCKICPDAVGGVADIACADAWYGDQSGYPLFEERDGRSLVVTRTAAGENVLQEALAAGAIEAEPLDIEAIDLMQPSQAQRKRLIRARTLALTLTLQPQPDMRGTLVVQAARRASLLEQLRNLLGTVRRIIVRKR